MLAQDAASRTPNALEAEWRSWERRNPGIAHPGRAAARMARGTEARSTDWAQGTSRFVRPSSNIAEQARASRARQLRSAVHLQNAGPASWDDDDLQAEMIDLGNFRRGRKF